MHIDIEGTQIGRIFPPDYSIVSDAKAALVQLLAAARERAQRTGGLPDYSAWVRSLSLIHI